MGLIIDSKEAGFLFVEIANQMKSQSVVCNCSWRTWPEEGRERRSRGSGRRKVTNERQGYLLRT